MREPKRRFPRTYGPYRKSVPVLNPRALPQPQEKMDREVEHGKRALNRALRHVFQIRGAVAGEMLSNGTNLMFRVNQDTVARVTRPDFPLARAATERRIHQRLYDAGLPVVRPIGDFYPAHGRIVTFYEHLEGENSGPYNEADGEALARLHNFPKAGIRANNPLYFAEPRLVVIERLSKQGLVDRDTLHKVKRCYRAADVLAERTRKKARTGVVHGDIWAENFFHTAQGSVLIDFDSVGVGTIEEDFARAEHWYGHASPAERIAEHEPSYRNDLLSGYRAAGGVVDPDLVRDLMPIFDFNKVLLAVLRGSADERWRQEAARRLDGLQIVNGSLRSDPDLQWAYPA